MSGAAIIPACPSARLAAWLVDACMSFMIMLAMVYRYTGNLDVRGFVLGTSYGQLAVVLGLPLLVHVITMTSTSASVGMYTADLRLSQEDGDAATFSNVIRRPLGLIGFFMTLGFAAALPYMNDRRRTLGDILSGTRVIETPAPGRRIAYDPWRLFKICVQRIAPLTVVGSIALLLITNDSGPNKIIVLDALLLAAGSTLMLAMLLAVLKSKVSRVRLTSRGIQRSGWFGWKKEVVKWTDIDFARYRPALWCPYFDMHKNNHRRFRVPIEHDTARLTANVLAEFGVRLEQ